MSRDSGRNWTSSLQPAEKMGQSSYDYGTKWICLLRSGEIMEPIAETAARIGSIRGDWRKSNESGRPGFSSRATGPCKTAWGDIRG